MLETLQKMNVQIIEKIVFDTNHNLAAARIIMNLNREFIDMCDICWWYMLQECSRYLLFIYMWPFITLITFIDHVTMNCLICWGSKIEEWPSYWVPLLRQFTGQRSGSSCTKAASTECWLDHSHEKTLGISTEKTEVDYIIRCLLRILQLYAYNLLQSFGIVTWFSGKGMSSRRW